MVSLDVGWNIPGVNSTALLTLERSAGWDGLSTLLGSDVTTVFSMVSLNVGWNIPGIDGAALLALEGVASWNRLGALLGSDVSSILTVVGLNVSWDVPGVNSTAVLALEGSASWNGLGGLLSFANGTSLKVTNWSLNIGAITLLILGWSLLGVLDSLRELHWVDEWLVHWLNWSDLVLALHDGVGLALEGGAVWDRLLLGWSSLSLGEDVATLVGTVVGLDGIWDFPSISGGS